MSPATPSRKSPTPSTKDGRCSSPCASISEERRILQATDLQAIAPAVTGGEAAGAVLSSGRANCRRRRTNTRTVPRRAAPATGACGPAWPARSGGSTTSLLPGSRTASSVRERVQEIVDAEAQGFGGRRERKLRLVNPFPEIAHIVVGVQEHDQAAVLIIVAHKPRGAGLGVRRLYL